MEESQFAATLSLNFGGHSPIQVKYCIRQYLSALRKKQGLERKLFKNNPNVLLNNGVLFHL